MRTHAQAAQRCLFTITTPLTRGNNAECVKALRGERRTKPIFVSQLALPPDWAAPLCETSHRKTFPLRTQRATLMCKCMQENFRKAEITEPNEVAALKLLGLWIITTRFSGTFLSFLGNNDFSGLIEENPNVGWSYCFPVAGGRSYHAHTINQWTWNRQKVAIMSPWFSPNFVHELSSQYLPAQEKSVVTKDVLVLFGWGDDAA